MIRRLTNRYNRWRHNRGFGVHSPYAYRLLTDWLRPGAGYGLYGDEDIDDALTEMAADCKSMSGATMRALRRRARMLLRLLAATTPRTLWLSADAPQTLRVAARCAGYHYGGRLVADWRKATMLVITGEESTLFGAELMRWLTVSGRSILMLDVTAGAVDNLYAALPYGLMLRWPKAAFITHRRGMSKLCYTLPSL